LIQILVSECDDFKHCDDTTREYDVTSLALSYRLPIGHEPINRFVSEIFSIKIADRQTDTHIQTR